MALHPAIQDRAQQEVDRVTGGQRLPLLKDRPALRYLEYILLEVLRWNPVGPLGTFLRSLADPSRCAHEISLGLPHLLDRDDVYEGYHLPKGSIIIPNVWCVASLNYICDWVPSIWSIPQGYATRPRCFPRAFRV